MTLIQSLTQKGIRWMGDVTSAIKQVGASAGIIPVQWPHETRPGLVWRIPEPANYPQSEKVTIANIFAKRQPIVVREFERAIVLENGKLYAEMPPGLFDITKVPIHGSLEIIWVSVSQSQHPWGVGGIMTADCVTVGGFGTVFLQIIDATKFVLQLVTAEQLFGPEQIKTWIQNLVKGVMRQEFATRDVRSLMIERDAFVQGCKQKLESLFTGWGLEFKHLEVVELTLPPEYRTAVQKVTLAGFTQQSALIEAETQARIAQITAQAEATALLTTGAAEVQMKVLMQKHGIDPVKSEILKALMEYAKTPSGGQGGALISGDLYKPQVFTMLSQMLLDPTVPGEIKQTLRQTFPQQSEAIVATPQALPVAAPVSPELSSTPNVGLTAEKIQETIDNLDMQLSQGRLTEATYNRLREKWETKLKEL